VLNGYEADVANLSRDKTKTNGTVSQTPDVQALLNEQADLMEAMRAAGQVVAQAIGTYASMKKEEADKAATAAWEAGDMNTYNAAVAESKSWDEGGSNYRAACCGWCVDRWPWWRQYRNRTPGRGWGRPVVSDGEATGRYLQGCCIGDGFGTAR
jgi:hypothetical protein